MSTIKSKKTVEREVSVDKKCDACGKLAGMLEPKDWHGFSHHHSAWGNDSVDSFEWFDVCSVSCFARQLEKSIKEIGNRLGGEVSDMNIPFAKQLLAALTEMPEDWRPGADAF